MICTVLACCAAALLQDPQPVGDHQLIIDLVDPSDGIMQPPEGVVSIDFQMTGLSSVDTWSAAGIRGVTFGGARMIYAISSDPNTMGEITLVAPGTSQRFTTFFGLGARDSNSRYRNTNPVIAGEYCPVHPTPVYTETEFNVVAFCCCPSFPYCYCKFSCPVSLWFLRVSLDISPLLPVIASDLVISRIGEEPAGYVPLFLSTCVDSDASSPGTCTISWTQISCITAYSWGLYARLEAPHVLPGDLNHDCDVNLYDLVALLHHFGTPSGGEATYEDGDIFGDGGVDLTDLVALLQHYGETCP